MKRREVREVLATHADQLGNPSTAYDGRLTRNSQVQALLDLAEQLQGILVPVEPDIDFRRRLHGELLLESQRRQGEPAPNRFQQHRKGILIGAAAVGSAASIAGVVVAFFLHLRHDRATPTATS